MTVAGLVLAAGSGSRYGGPKALAELDGELFVERAGRLLAEGGCDPVLTVLGASAQEVAQRARLGPVVVADDWATGMGASLRAGLAALEAGQAEACVVALADQPLVGVEAVRRLLRAYQDGAVAAVATYGGAPRNPVLLSRSTWKQVAALAQGDAGARAWLRAHPEQVAAVACDDTGSPFDVDTPDDHLAVTHLAVTQLAVTRTPRPDPRRVRTP